MIKDGIWPEISVRLHRASGRPGVRLGRRLGRWTGPWAWRHLEERRRQQQCLERSERNAVHQRRGPTWGRRCFEVTAVVHRANAHRHIARNPFQRHIAVASVQNHRSHRTHGSTPGLGRIQSAAISPRRTRPRQRKTAGATGPLTRTHSRFTIHPNLPAVLVVTSRG